MRARESRQPPGTTCVWAPGTTTTGPASRPRAASRAIAPTPGFWYENRTPLSITGIGVGIALIILLIVLLRVSQPSSRRATER